MGQYCTFIPGWWWRGRFCPRRRCRWPHRSGTFPMKSGLTWGTILCILAAFGSSLPHPPWGRGGGAPTLRWSLDPNGSRLRFGWALRRFAPKSLTNQCRIRIVIIIIMMLHSHFSHAFMCENSIHYANAWSFIYLGCAARLAKLGRHAYLCCWG